MSTYETNLPAWDVSGVIQTLYGVLDEATRGRVAIAYHIDVGATDGYRSITVGYTIPGEFGGDLVFTILFMGCAAAAQISAREVVGAAGVLAPVLLRGFPPSDPLSGFGAALGFWNEFFVDTIVTMLNEWTPAIAEAGTSLHYEPITGESGTAAVAVSVQTDGEAMFLPLQMLYQRFAAGTQPPYAATFPTAAIQTAGASVTVVNPGMDRVVQALQDIALRSVVTSVNDRTAIYELGTNDILIPG